MTLERGLSKIFDLDGAKSRLNSLLFRPQKSILT